MTRSLFDISDDLRALALLMDECDAELTRETSEALDEWFAELSQGEAVKLDGYVGLIKQNEMEAAAAKAEAEQYAMKARARENRVRWLKERVKGYLEATGRTKVQTATNRTIAIQANGGVQKLSIAPGINPENVPAEFQVVTVTFNNDRIREALDGADKPVWAKLEPRGTSLRIR